MEETRIVLVRHGESLAQHHRVIGGHRGCKGLSDRGRAQVEALRDRLADSGELAGTTALYSSVMARAAETADILAPALDGLDVRRECVFCESHPGDEGDGLEVDEYDRRWPIPDGWTVDSRRDPGSETFQEMSERVGRALDTLVERHPGETVVVACHGGVVVHSMLRWLGIDFTTGERAWLNAVNSSLTEWRIAPNPFWPDRLPVELVRFNDHAHLRGTLAPRRRRNPASTA